MFLQSSKQPFCILHCAFLRGAKLPAFVPHRSHCLHYCSFLMSPIKMFRAFKLVPFYLSKNLVISLLARNYNLRISSNFNGKQDTRARNFPTEVNGNESNNNKNKTAFIMNETNNTFLNTCPATSCQKCRTED